jgi:hypothetical protein
LFPVAVTGRTLMPRPSLAQRICLSALLVSAMFPVIILSIYVVVGHSTSSPIARKKSETFLAGTWRGDHGVILNLRPDGSARSRSENDPANTIQYFQWRFNNGVFSAEVAAPPQNISRRLRQLVLGRTTFRYDIVSMSPNEFRMSTTDGGRILVFSLTSDPLLESTR